MASYPKLRAELDAERALADDLANVLNHLLFHHADADSEIETEIEAALTDYREARGR